MTALTLIRHGETDWNRERRIQGATDIPLNDTGREQARATAAALRERFGADALVTIAASDLSRARETAQIIAAELGLGAPRIYRGLRERSYGEAEGVRVDEFQRRWGDWLTAAVPGAEPRDELRSRALSSLGRAVRDHRRVTAPINATLIVVSHGALIRELLGHASGGEFPLAGERLANGSTHDFVYERDHLSLVAYAAALV